MKTPSDTLLKALAKALEEAEHQSVAEHILAGFLWAAYPEWYDQHLRGTRTYVIEPDPR